MEGDKKMSAFVLNRNYELILPENYVDFDRNEMEYVDGGWCIENHWWGYNLYLTHKERVNFTDLQAIGGLGAALASMGILAATIGGVATVIWNHDDGYGVRIRMTGPLKYNAVITGAYALSSYEEKNIAKRNKVIW